MGPKESHFLPGSEMPQLLLNALSTPQSCHSFLAPRTRHCTLPLRLRLLVQVQVSCPGGPKQPTLSVVLVTDRCSIELSAMVTVGRHSATILLYILATFGQFMGAIAVDGLKDDDFMARGSWRKLQASKKSCSLATFKPPRKIKSGPSFGYSFLCLVGFLSCLPVVGASSARAPGSSSSAMPSTLQIFSYIFGSATIIGKIIAFVVCFRGCYPRRERGDDEGGPLDVLTLRFERAEVVSTCL